MNIHLTKKNNYNLIKNLFNSTILQVEFGSKLYGIKVKDSDTDIMCIFVPTTEMKKSHEYSTSVHQFQYKDTVNNIDYIFTDLYSFVDNIINGDSSINFEIIHSDTIKNDKNLSFLYDMKEMFYTYKVLKGYTGKCKKDIKNMYKYGKTNRGINKKLIHAYRSHMTARTIFENIYTLELGENDKEVVEMIRYISKDQTVLRVLIATSIKQSNKELRETINKALEDGYILYKPDLSKIQLIYSKINDLLMTDNMLDKLNNDLNILIDLVNDAKENGITY